jgi:thiol-disulfide isomerase/thioredoxin
MTDATDHRPPRARNPLIFWIVLALGGAGVFVYLLLVTTPSSSPQGPPVGHSLGYLQLEGLTGGAKNVSLDDLQGRVTLLNYWGTWCPPCLREFPELVKLGEKFADRDGFRMVLVSCGGEGDDSSLDLLRHETEDFLASRGLMLPIYADQNAASRRAMMLILEQDVMPYPTTLIFDRQGVIRGYWPGYSRHAVGEMTDLIERLLAEPAN